jgi:hypothetical protein
MRTIFFILSLAVVSSAFAARTNKLATKDSGFVYYGANKIKLGLYKTTKIVAAESTTVDCTSGTGGAWAVVPCKFGDLIFR